VFEAFGQPVAGPLGGLAEEAEEAEEVEEVDGLAAVVFAGVEGLADVVIAEFGGLVGVALVGAVAVAVCAGGEPAAETDDDCPEPHPASNAMLSTTPAPRTLILMAREYTSPD
jgi:hypothetical protein